MFGRVLHILKFVERDGTIYLMVITVNGNDGRLLDDSKFVSAGIRE